MASYRVVDFCSMELKIEANLDSGYFTTMKIRTCIVYAIETTKSHFFGRSSSCGGGRCSRSSNGHENWQWRICYGHWFGAKIIVLVIGFEIVI